LILTILSKIISPIKKTSEKLSAFECGFEPMGDSKDLFSIHFYMVGILFLIFDLEILFLFP
jgi:NADH-quinone oxidoreductase subunit A